MLRIIDARTGESVAAAPARRGLTRVEVHASGDDTGALRVLLVADVLVRALELGGTPVLATLTAGTDPTKLRAAAAALGIRPFEEGRDRGDGVSGAQALHVVRAGARTPDGVRIGVGPVLTQASASPDADPDVLRLALLSHRHGDSVALDATALDAARDTLARWRGAVADWARRPSRPVPEEVRGRLRTAWEDDLDVPEVLRILRRVEEAGPQLPDGARFETYAYADRLLGLELTRDVGSPS
ncbi:hypothetical protein ABZ330_03940 [Streptomyces sp. NPDC006172]|uniref:hypothetical protein n=1 Tax=Streptomyces sp. NPDC006172 TaxID=3154470 RepID=UPI0033E4D650